MLSLLFAACHGLTGSGFVFYRNPYSGQWQLNQSYPSPAGYQGHFGYAVDIAQNYSVIGAYGYDDLRGAVFLADRAPEIVPVPPVVFVEPTMAPTGPAEVLSGGGLNRRVNKTSLTLGMVLALALGVLIVAAATGLVCYCCCCMVPIIPLLKKKKKKEEVRPIDRRFSPCCSYVFLKLACSKLVIPILTLLLFLF